MMKTQPEPMSADEAARVAARMVKMFHGDRADAIFAANRAGLPEVAAAIRGES